MSTTPVDYEAALAVMQARAGAISAGTAPELIWLLEHPALFTAGTSAKREDLLAADLLPVYQSGRGGQYTYHGPGQRVLYLMLNLRARGGDVRKLIGALEDWMIMALADLGVVGERRADRVGIWVGRPELGETQEDKIAAIGLRVTRGVTTHGMSLNVTPDLGHYRGIIACGIKDHGVTSLADLGISVTLRDVDQALLGAFEKLFGAVRAVKPPL